MAIIKASASHSNIKNVINYVSKKEKTEYKFLSGYNCSPDTAAVEMQLVKELYSKTSGRSYKHFIQSFVPGEVTPETAHRIANEFTEGCSVFSGYQVLIATHIDKEHIHTHFILNSVSCDSGYKFQMTPKDLQAMKYMRRMDAEAKLIAQDNKDKTKEQQLVPRVSLHKLLIR